MDKLNANKLVVIFPGIGYTADKPLLYYSLSMVRELGFKNIISVKYPLVDKTNLRGNPAAMEAVFNALYEKTVKQLESIKWDEYDEIVFISKSIGTIVASAYADRNHLLVVKHILYTPLENTFDFNVGRAIAFTGTKDGWGDSRTIVKLAKEADVDIEEYEGCNHSLETDNTIDNMNRLRDIISRARDFLI